MPGRCAIIAARPDETNYAVADYSGFQMDEQVRFAERVECGGLAPLRVVPVWQITKPIPERRQAAALHTLRASTLPMQLKAAVIRQLSYGSVRVKRVCERNSIFQRYD
jgi:hypothetical protein